LCMFATGRGNAVNNLFLMAFLRFHNAGRRNHCWNLNKRIKEAKDRSRFFYLLNQMKHFQTLLNPWFWIVQHHSAFLIDISEDPPLLFPFNCPSISVYFVYRLTSFFNGRWCQVCQNSNTDRALNGQNSISVGIVSNTDPMSIGVLLRLLGSRWSHYYLKI
jgi:hypothetical protein